MSKQTPLFAAHVQAGGKMVDFAGWQMPLNYGSQISEHQVVRETAGMFDVSHMTVIDVTGRGASEFLRHVVANGGDVNESFAGRFAHVDEETFVHLLVYQFIF